MSPETRAAAGAGVIGQVLAHSDERDQWLKFAVDWARDVYRYAYADGRADEARDADQAWAAVPVRRALDGPSLDELEQRRWGPGGRESFGDPRPGDYQGGAL